MTTKHLIQELSKTLYYVEHDKKEYAIDHLEHLIKKLAKQSKEQ